MARLHLLDSLTVIASFFFFNAGTAKLPQSSDGNTITLLVIFLVVIALATLLQQKTVDLTKKMNPEKRGSVYDMKFQERWWESCDEAERRQIGQASYKAYVTVSRFCPYCWGVLLLGNMVFHYGILPSAVVLVIWAVLSVSYTREAIRLGRRGQAQGRDEHHGQDALPKSFHEQGSSLQWGHWGQKTREHRPPVCRAAR